MLRLRLTTLNAWHGLDPYRPRLMLPMQSLGELRRRYADQVHALAADSNRDTDVFLLQELNPWQLRLNYLARKLGMRSAGAGVNEGLRLGAFGYPPLLDEGLGILYPERVVRAREQTTRLSGRALKPKLPFGIPASLQLAEIRAALAVSFDLGHGSERLRVGVVNVHLHAGAGDGRGTARRAREVEALSEWTAPLRDECDLLWIGGDFNCPPDAPELRPLRDEGFEETIAREGGPDWMTWSPRENPLCRHGISHAPQGSSQLAWDQREHRLDQLHLRVHPRRAADLEVRTSTTRVFDSAPYLSDHFGLRCELKILPKP